ncbi:MAG: UDP-N-acetylmuramoyl-L-alanyl-D-glutamate--2,6-diaminopimelate ligase [Patescibacteria group bacterium]
MKKLVQKIIPTKLVSMYHFLLAYIAPVIYGFPSKKLIVIGVTGTKGKTSSINYIWSVLNAGAIKTGIVTTANIRIGEEESLNSFHMTMPGRFILQKFLRKMVYEKCEVAIIETTSQGISQYRHIGIDYDVAVFTNLSPEHIDSHGSFENYKTMKGKLFESLSSAPRKYWRGEKFGKAIIANADDEHYLYFSSFKADKKIAWSIKNASDNKVESVTSSGDGVEFALNGDNFKLMIPGVFNVHNALPAILVGKLFNISKEKIAEGLSSLRIISGRMEEIENTGKGFRVFVDYAHEKQSMTGVMEAAKYLKNPDGKIIVLLGAEGGGRDKGKRPIMGEIVGRLADIVVVSNVDPYDDDPAPIIEDIVLAAEAAGKKRGENLFAIEDRREGIAKCLSVAHEGDVVIITGKGAEQSMIIGGKSIPWDDRAVVREEMQKI